MFFTLCYKYVKQKLYKLKNKIMEKKNWDDIMLTLLDGGDLQVAKRLNIQSQEYKDELLDKVNKLNIRDLQEFIFGYMCGSKIINNS
jgi:ribosome assembly protein YihI (activator of Der GTPase)